MCRKETIIGFRISPTDQMLEGAAEGDLDSTIRKKKKKEKASKINTNADFLYNRYLQTRRYKF